MTTIVGIKTNYELESIVIGADTQLSISDSEGNSWKGSTYKIINGKNWAMGHAGGIGRKLYDFQRMLRGRKKGISEEKATEMIEEAIRNFNKGQKYKNPHFIEVNYLNTLHYRGESDFNQLHTFILAVNYPNLGLWEIDEFGSLKKAPDVREFEYVAIGSGSNQAIEYINHKISRSKVDPDQINIDKAIDLVVSSLHRAEEDIYTGGGIDLTILTKSNIFHHGKRIRNALARAEKEVIEKIKIEYNPPINGKL